MRKLLTPQAASRTPHAARWREVVAGGSAVLLLALAGVALARLLPASGEFSPFGLEFRQQDQLRGDTDSVKLNPGVRSAGQVFRSDHADLSSVAVQLGKY